MDARSKYYEIISKPAVWIPAEFAAAAGFIGIATSVKQGNAAGVAECGAVTLACLDAGMRGEVIYRAQTGAYRPQ
jgi:hypothetical protein